ncbi:MULTISPECIES: DUF6502 family protein [unclassified Polaromonas]|uniref:DUF6502 family protein n=1 Tax=unclassified Polaromonas TaxID=2638319 RepID=UPI0018CA96B0|nr:MULTISPECIES: DUF6502 family protein [unclassified Polaromonas]MBG6072479.1 hypothetical protein [Polaromonas sp. CG_9.7]MBG6114483.1 hypothetical protein [Polaromonas sp. CG_9.2]MDH6185434.1 hypothetical protein [Polaromonas sp. CG_23.6]
MLTSQTPATPSPALVLALRRVLRPMVKLLLAQGITYPYLAELLKALFVDIADKDFRLDAKPPTDSRVSLISGVHRKEVNRLRQEMASDAEIVPSVVSLGAQLVAVWLGSAHYIDEYNRPKPLARFVSDGGALSFEALVAGVNSDIRPRVVLDEWLRLGVVRFDEEQRVCLNVAAFVPVEGFDEKAFYFGHNLHDHVAAAAHNLMGVGKPFLERTVHCDELSANSIAALAAQSEQVGMQALLAINKSAMALEAADASDTAPRQRMTFGIYFYAEPAMPGKEPPPDA